MKGTKAANQARAGRNETMCPPEALIRVIVGLEKDGIGRRVSPIAE